MVDRYIFSDEAGCFTFNRNQNVSRYFILCTVTLSSIEVGQSLHSLRHRLVWDGHPVGDYFHATVDKQSIRDQVYEEILKHDFRVQATICEKSKAQPQVKSSKARFYKYPWYYHFKQGIGGYVENDTSLLVTAASIGTKKEKATYTNAIDDVLSQTVKQGKWVVDFRPSQADPCLQVADYCAWAIQRKWERDDNRAYDLISDRITYEYELWKRGTTHYY
jgi:hypothetical protein